MFDHSNNTCADDMKIDVSVLVGKSSLEMLGLTFSSKLDWGSYITSTAKTVSKKIGALTSFYEVWIEYCCHVYSGAPSCYLKLLDKVLV